LITLRSNATMYLYSNLLNEKSLTHTINAHLNVDAVIDIVMSAVRESITAHGSCASSEEFHNTRLGSSIDQHCICDLPPENQSSDNVRLDNKERGYFIGQKTIQIRANHQQAQRG